MLHYDILYLKYLPTANFSNRCKSKTCVSDVKVYQTNEQY